MLTRLPITLISPPVPLSPHPLQDTTWPAEQTEIGPLEAPMASLLR